MNDYTKAGLRFKVQKALRYFRLYGPRRTFIKIIGVYHGKKKFDEKVWINKSVSDSANRMIAIVGCGNFAFSNIAYYLKKHDSRFLRGTFDSNYSHAASLCFHYKGLLIYKSIDDLINDSKVKLVYIASNHASHAEYAIQCINAGKHVHIEKPTTVSFDQLVRLISSIKMHPDVKCFQGFNRPKSKLFYELNKYLRKESSPMMINWFIAGHEISDDHWYFDKAEGGRILGNLCHWSDLTLELVGIDNAFPCLIKSTAPPDSKSDFVISIEFGDRSCATITFSAKGHTFEGVREVLNIHKGNLLGTLKDFQSLDLDIIEKKIAKRLLFRDHGHKANIINSYMSSLGNTEGVSIQYLTASTLLILKIKESVDTGNSISLTKEDIDKLIN
jgi:predicted dehydrogenase